MSFKNLAFALLACLPLWASAGLLKSVIYDFEGLPAHQTALPDGFYTYGDASYETVINPLGYSGMLGNTSLKLTLNGSNGYAGVGRGISRFIELNTQNDKLNFYVLNPGSQPLSFTVFITEDDNNDGVYQDNTDDKFQMPVSVPPSASWQLISLSLNKFSDGNTGGDGILNEGYTNHNGRLFNIEFRFSTSGMTLPRDLYLDMLCFSEGDLPTGSSATDRPLAENGSYCRLGTYGANSQNAPELVPAEFEGLFTPAKTIRYVNTFLAYSNTSTTPDNYPGTGIEALLKKGYRPLITLEPFYSSLAPLDSRQPRLKDITSGAFDFYYNTLADKIRQYSDTVYIRPMHEFDGDWYPWCISQNGGDPSLFAAAYKHIVDVFRARGTKNVKWMWCPNAYPAPNADYNWSVMAYPGTDYVDVVGTNIYNHPNAGTPIWRSFRYLLAETYYYCRKYFFDKPFFVFEASSRERESGEGSSVETKPEWIVEMDKELRSNFDKVRALIWFNVPKEHDWRINSSFASQNAYQNSIWANDYYFKGFITGLSPNSKEGGLLVFPNPCRQSLSLSLLKGEKEKYKIALFTISGVRVRFIQEEIPYRMDVSGLHPGMYILNVEATGKSSYAQTLIIQ